MYAAVLLLAPAAAIDRRQRAPFYLVSAILALNLYLFYGFGFGWPPVIERTWTPIDMTVMLSVANVVTFFWWTGTRFWPRQIS